MVCLHVSGDFRLYDEEDFSSFGSTMSLPEYLYEVYSSPMARHRMTCSSSGSSMEDPGGGSGNGRSPGGGPSPVGSALSLTASSLSLADTEYFSAHSRPASLYSFSGYESSVSNLTDADYQDARSSFGSSRYDSFTSLSDAGAPDGQPQLLLPNSDQQLPQGAYNAVARWRVPYDVSRGSMSSLTDASYHTATSGGSDMEATPGSRRKRQAHHSSGSDTDTEGSSPYSPNYQIHFENYSIPLVFNKLFACMQSVLLLIAWCSPAEF